MDWIVYILKCKDGSLYTGITTNLERRVKEHETGKGARYTKGRAPLIVVYKEMCKDRSEASKRELEIKALPRLQKIELISV